MRSPVRELSPLSLSQFWGALHPSVPRFSGVPSGEGLGIFAGGTVTPGDLFAFDSLVFLPGLLPGDEVAIKPLPPAMTQAIIAAINGNWRGVIDAAGDQGVWDALGLPTGLDCPQGGGVFGPLCGGVSPASDWKGSYADCVKKAGEDFSLQNALRSFSPKWGDSWFASTFLGNEYSDYIGYGQDLYSRNGKGIWKDIVQYVEGKDVEKLERESVKKIVETANPYNLGAVVVSAGVLCPVTYEGK